MGRGTWIALSVTVAAAVAVGVLLFGRAGPPPDLPGNYLDPPLPAPSVDPVLMSSEGEVRLSDLHGRHTAIFFGYTHCPDVCPLTLARIARAKGLMPAEAAEKIQVVMVTVDPERDTPEITDAYARRFDPSFMGLSGERSEIDSLAAAYGIFHGKARGEAGEGENYLVDHTASVLVLDPAGRVRMLLGQDLSAEEIAQALGWLVGG